MAIAISQAVLQHRGSVAFPVPGAPDVHMRFKRFRVTGNMISGAAQQHKKRLIPLPADGRDGARQSGKTPNMEDIWKNGGIELPKIFEKVDSAGRARRARAGNPLFLRLNIGGVKYMILVDALLRAENTTFLTKFVQLTHPSRLKIADAYMPGDDAYFFQRSPVAFEAIYQYYATGIIHRPSEIIAEPPFCRARLLADIPSTRGRVIRILSRGEAREAEEGRRKK
ncbi:unnamed protein product, partial [Mesorhabditis spiculigera]